MQFNLVKILSAVPIVCLKNGLVFILTINKIADYRMKYGIIEKIAVII